MKIKFIQEKKIRLELGKKTFVWKLFVRIGRIHYEQTFPTSVRSNRYYRRGKRKREREKKMNQRHWAWVENACLAKRERERGKWYFYVQFSSIIQQASDIHSNIISRNGSFFQISPHSPISNQSGQSFLALIFFFFFFFFFDFFSKIYFIIQHSSSSSL